MGRTVKSRNVKVSNLSKAIAEEVKIYTDEVTKAVDKKLDETAEQVLTEVKSNHPYEDRDGEYSNGFAITKEERGFGESVRIIWNKEHYRRVHLLEFGHVDRSGENRVPAYPHLVPAYDKYVPKMAREIRKVIKIGG
jgi:hypothetical protein